MVLFILMQQQIDTTAQQATPASEEVTAPLEWLFESNPILAWALVIAGLLVLVTIAYYAVEFFRKSISSDPLTDTAEKLSELEQLKSTSYMTEEEKRRLNAASPIAAMAKDGEIDPELAVFRKVKEQRMSNQNSPKEPMFNEIDDNPND